MGFTQIQTICKRKSPSMYSTNWNLAGMPPQAMRARCSGFRYCPDPLGVVPAEVLDKLEFVKLALYHYVSFVVQTNRAFFLLYYHLD